MFRKERTLVVAISNNVRQISSSKTTLQGSVTLARVNSTNNTFTISKRTERKLRKIDVRFPGRN